jgi:hypothetical protein
LTLKNYLFLFFDYLVEANGTIKNGSKRKDSSPPPISNTNNIDPVRKDKFYQDFVSLIFFLVREFHL